MKRRFKKLLLLAILLFGKECLASFHGELGELSEQQLRQLVQDIDVLRFNGGGCDPIDTNCPSGGPCRIVIGPCSTVFTSKLNAAPSQVSFSRYLLTANPSRFTITKANEQIALVGLTKKHNYTTILQYQPNGKTTISYLFIALPTTPSEIDTIKNLPLKLANYLEKQNDVVNGTIIKVYKSAEESSQWTEVATIPVSTVISDQIVQNAKIDTATITQNGDLVLTYKNLKKQDGKIIPTTQVTYTGFK